MFKKDYLDILGLPDQAGEADIKKAYRKLTMAHCPELNPGREAEITELLANGKEAHDTLLALVRNNPRSQERVYNLGLLHHYDDLKSLFETYSKDVWSIEEDIEFAKNEYVDCKGFLRSCWMNADRKMAQRNLRDIAYSQTHKGIVSVFQELKVNVLTEVISVPGSLQQEAFAKRVSDTKASIREQDNLIENWFAVLRGQGGVRLKDPQP